MQAVALRLDVLSNTLNPPNYFPEPPVYYLTEKFLCTPMKENVLLLWSDP